MTQLEAGLEAVLFAAGDAVPVDRLVAALETSRDALLDAARRELAQTLDSSIRAMAAAFALWDFGVYGPVIESTVYEGLYAVGTAVLDGTFHRQKQVRRKKGGHLYA